VSTPIGNGHTKVLIYSCSYRNHLPPTTAYSTVRCHTKMPLKRLECHTPRQLAVISLGLLAHSAALKNMQRSYLVRHHSSAHSTFMCATLMDIVDKSYNRVPPGLKLHFAQSRLSKCLAYTTHAPMTSAVRQP
jgi:hypothetical protein